MLTRAAQLTEILLGVIYIHKEKSVIVLTVRSGQYPDGHDVGNQDGLHAHYVDLIVFSTFSDGRDLFQELQLVCSH